ncbi:MAG TPA: FKBP-type peptidyl-prolyl cis-trans isomerase [Sphingomonadaceae bacterium]|nr:FKBP-type peptidyl-prolyl cis-trans isomerase [Sphingomonadaceae bacterium]
MSTTAVPIKPIAKGSIAKLWMGLALLVAAAGAAAWAGTRSMAVLTTPSGLRYQILEEGRGPNATAEDVAVIQYEGRLPDGSVFDSSEGKGPVPLPVAGSIPGFSEALQLMNKGAKARVWIPANLAYGPEGSGPIPPNSELEFDITLVDRVPLSALRGGGGAPPGM